MGKCSEFVIQDAVLYKKNIDISIRQRIMLVVLLN